jgi:hypothetical protein
MRSNLAFGTYPTCGYEMFAMLPQSPCRHEVDPVLAPLDGFGTVYSWTRVSIGDETTEVIAMADFREGRVRVTAPVLEGSMKIRSSVVLPPGATTAYAFVAG